MDKDFHPYRWYEISLLGKLSIPKAGSSPELKLDILIKSYNASDDSFRYERLRNVTVYSSYGRDRIGYNPELSDNCRPIAFMYIAETESPSVCPVIWDQDNWESDRKYRLEKAKPECPDTKSGSHDFGDDGLCRCGEHQSTFSAIQAGR